MSLNDKRELYFSSMILYLSNPLTIAHPLSTNINSMSFLLLWLFSVAIQMYYVSACAWVALNFICLIENWKLIFAFEKSVPCFVPCFVPLLSEQSEMNFNFSIIAVLHSSPVRRCCRQAFFYFSVFGTSILKFMKCRSKWQSLYLPVFFLLSSTETEKHTFSPT